MIPRFYYRVCDNCGNIDSVSPDFDGDYKCAACEHGTGWEFPLHAKALDMQRQIRDRNKS